VNSKYSIASEFSLTSSAASREEFLLQALDYNLLQLYIRQSRTKSALAENNGKAIR